MHDHKVLRVTILPRDVDHTQSCAVGFTLVCLLVLCGTDHKSPLLFGLLSSWSLSVSAAFFTVPTSLVEVPWAIMAMVAITALVTLSKCAVKMLADKVIVAFVWTSRGGSRIVYTVFDCSPLRYQRFCCVALSVVVVVAPTLGPCHTFGTAHTTQHGRDFGQMYSYLFECTYVEPIVHIFTFVQYQNYLRLIWYRSLYV